MTYDTDVEAAAQAICRVLGHDVWTLLAQVERDRYRRCAEEARDDAGWNGADEDDW